MEFNHLSLDCGYYDNMWHMVEDAVCLLPKDNPAYFPKELIFASVDLTHFWFSACHGHISNCTLIAFESGVGLRFGGPVPDPSWTEPELRCALVWSPKSRLG